MNLHAIAVHLPIGILSLYAVLELVRHRRLLVQPFWLPLKGVLAVAGALASLAARQTGELLAEQIERFGNAPAALAVHESWGTATVAIFSSIAAAYLLSGLARAGGPLARRVPPGLLRLGIRLAGSGWNALAAAVGLVAITVTGALGGGMVYGPNVDPVAALVYRLLGL